MEISTDEGATGGAFLNEKPNPDRIQKQIVNDFVIPAVKPDEKEKHQGRQFQIRYDVESDHYMVKDLGIGYGVFTETIGAIPLKDNQLINMGESYMVTNLIPASEEEEFDFNEGNPIFKVKLRVFSVSKSDTPDLYSFVDPD